MIGDIFLVTGSWVYNGGGEPHKRKFTVCYKVALILFKTEIKEITCFPIINFFFTDLVRMFFRSYFLFQNYYQKLW